MRYRIQRKGNTTKEYNSVYMGTTKQKLKNRTPGQMSNIRNKHTTRTALTVLAIEKNHTPDFYREKILQTEENTNKRLTIEMLYKARTENTINKKSDTAIC